MTARLDEHGMVQLAADSESAISKGLAAILVHTLSGRPPQHVLEVRPHHQHHRHATATHTPLSHQLDPAVLQTLPLGPAVVTPSRSNSLVNMLETVVKLVRLLVADLPRFPSLLLTAESIAAQGPFAEAQARYLQPQPAQVDRLAQLLQDKRIGVVAHFYMDPEVQGVLTSAAQQWPHVHISDSLVMADRAVGMAEAGCTSIAVLGVDFMSENVRAILDEAGWTDVAVYRMDPNAIGCSLAEAAESDLYAQYLGEAQGTPSSLHVVYINTSLRTKAQADHVVPTITCTSSNVVQTVLTAFAQVPDVTVWYGPDTYMGANLAKLLSTVAQLPDEEVKALHPMHTQTSIRDVLPRLRYFQVWMVCIGSYRVPRMYVEGLAAFWGVSLGGLTMQPKSCVHVYVLIFTHAICYMVCGTCYIFSHASLVCSCRMARALFTTCLVARPAAWCARGMGTPTSQPTLRSLGRCLRWPSRPRRADGGWLGRRKTSSTLLPTSTLLVVLVHLHTRRHCTRWNTLH